MTVAMLECEWPGCTSDQRTTGLCDMHHARKLRGEPDMDARVRTPRDGQCEEDPTCDKPIHGRRMCGMHYQRAWKAGEVP